MEAVDKEEEGTVEFQLSIGADGVPTRCIVINSSGSGSLDSTTCAILLQRGRFRPARDAKGGKVAHRMVGTIQWQLPEPGPSPFADEKQALVFTSNAEGVTNCRVEGSARLADERLCPFMMTKAASIAAEHKHITLTNREVVIEEGLLIGGPEAARGIGLGRGEALEMLNAVAIAIDAKGAISRCDAAQGSLSGQRAIETCTDIAKTKFAPLDSAATDRSDRHAVLYWATYTRPVR